MKNGYNFGRIIHASFPKERGPYVVNKNEGGRIQHHTSLILHIIWSGKREPKDCRPIKLAVFWGSVETHLPSSIACLQLVSEDFVVCGVRCVREREWERKSSEKGGKERYEKGELKRKPHTNADLHHADMHSILDLKGTKHRHLVSH